MPLGPIKCSSRAIRRFLWPRRFTPEQWKESAPLGVWPTDLAALLLPGVTRKGEIIYGIPDEIWPPSSAQEMGFPEYVDVIAVDPKRPGKWRLLLKNASWIARENIDYANFCQEPLRLARDPFDWLCLASQGARAVCWIGKNIFEFQDQVQFVSKITCSDPQHAAAVYKDLRRERPRRPPPDVSFPVKESGNEK